MKLPAPYLAVGLVLALAILLGGWTLLPLTSLARQLRTVPLDLPAESPPTTIPEPSGAAFHPDRGTILITSDEGGLWELSPAGARTDRFDIVGDLEAVAVHPRTGTVFLALERIQTILEYDLGARRTIREMRLDLAAAPGFPAKPEVNHGIEGLCVLELHDDICRLVIAWEARPARVAFLDADLSPEATESARQTRARTGQPLRQPTRIQKAFPCGPARLSGLTYDPHSRLILVLSAQDRTISACNASGKVIATYRLEISKPEGICLLPDGDAVITQEDADKVWFFRGLRQILPTATRNKD